MAKNNKIERASSTPKGTSSNLKLDNKGIKSIKLWLTDDWYIPVDEYGKCIGKCFEGAVGFVVQLISHRNSDNFMALKIPRLMAETHRENAYITELMDKELKAVEKIFLGGGNPSGLLNAFVSHGSFIQGPLSIKRGPEIAQKWDSSLVFVSFEKGQNPSFCLVRQERNKILTLPPKVKVDISTQALKEIKTAGKFKGNDWYQGVFIDFPSSSNHELASENIKTNEQIEIFSVDNALKYQAKFGTWYTSLPSVVYGWAPDTLQGAISRPKGRSRNGYWNLKKHLKLIRNISNGLTSLHNQGMLHADIRPANIVCQGDETNPDDYYIADYGSFAETGARGIEKNPGPGGLTVMGPIIGGERASAFYAPERSFGREKESADTAVIIKQDGGNLFLVLGWRKDLINSRTNEVENSIIKKVSEVSKLAQNESLLQGDRIQVRDYIFDVLEAWDDGEKQIIRCKLEYWKIYHGKIVVSSSDDFKRIDWLPVPRTIELLQWSASTDLYGLGALALYSIFHDVRTRPEKTKENLGSEKEKNLKLNNASQFEEDFKILLEYLASVPYFKTIWPDLEWLREFMEQKLQDESLNATEYANLIFREKFDTGHGEDITLRQRVIDISSRLSQTVPGARELITAFDHDLGQFIFFIHFVLCCLHRQAEMDPEDKNNSKELPFALSRQDQPKSETNKDLLKGAAEKARDRIEIIQELITKPALTKLKTDPDEIPKYDPRPDAEIRLQLEELISKVNRLENRRNELETNNDFLSEVLEKSKLLVTKATDEWRPKETLNETLELLNSKAINSATIRNPNPKINA